jgi:hypothetical protein
VYMSPIIIRIVSLGDGVYDSAIPTDSAEDKLIGRNFYDKKLQELIGSILDLNCWNQPPENIPSVSEKLKKLKKYSIFFQPKERIYEQRPPESEFMQVPYNNTSNFVGIVTENIINFYSLYDPLKNQYIQLSLLSQKKLESLMEDPNIQRIPCGSQEFPLLLNIPSQQTIPD